MRVSEIFRSVQGEGAHMGRSAVFVRFAGCRVGCSFCDTKESWTGGKEMSVGEVAADVLLLADNHDIVVLTGGEPLEQEHGELEELVKAIKSRGLRVHLETSGEINVPSEIEFDWVAVSPKPKLGYRLPNGRVDELKYVITPSFDPSVIPHGYLVYLQPGNGENMERVVALTMQGYGRAGLQAHLYWEVK